MIAPRRYGLLAAGAALVWLSLRGGAADTGRAAVVSGAIARSSGFQASRANVERDADRPQLAVSAAPGSLRGTEVDGDLTVGPDGGFVPTSGALRLFDYLLAARGETDVRALAATHIEQRLPASARADALALFDHYVAYLDQLGEVARDLEGRSTPRDYLEAARALQRERFGDRAEALFGSSNTIAEAVLDRAEIASRADLSPDQRAELRMRAEAGLPPRVRHGLARMRAPTEVAGAVAQLRRSGASEQDVWQLRAARLGADAADRLAAVDRRRGIGRAP